MFAWFTMHSYKIVFFIALHVAFFLRSSNVRSRHTIALSVVEKTSPLSAPTKNRARPPALQFRNESLQAAEDSTYDFIPEPDYSPPPSPPPPFVPSPLDATSPITRENQTSGKYKARISTNNQQENGDPRESGLYTRVIKTDSVKSPGVKTGEPFKTRPAPGAVNVLPNNGEFPKLKRVESKDNSFESDKQSPRGVYSNQVAAQSDYDDVSIMNVRKNSTDQTYANDLRRTDIPEKASSPREKTKHAPPIPTPGRPAPPVPCPPPAAPAAPAPPPQMQSRPLGKGHLKQVHWIRTPKPMVIWGPI